MLVGRSFDDPAWKERAEYVFTVLATAVSSVFGSIHATRVHGPSTRPVNTARECHFGHPCSRAVSTAVYVRSTRVDGLYLQKALHDNAFLRAPPVDTGARYMLPVFTGRRYGPCPVFTDSQKYLHTPVNTARKHGPCSRVIGTHYPCSRAVSTGRVHG